MNIDRYNCEAIFLDYYEKDLSPVEVAEMLFFLEENPDVKELFESYEHIILNAEKIKFPHKELLRNKYNKSEIDIALSSEVNKENCELFFVAASEGLLNKKQVKKLHSFISAAPGFKKDFELFQKCKLHQEKIVFGNKQLLKKQPVAQNHTLITAQNREEYFIRAIDNDISASEQKELTLFLQKNPEFKNEFELFKKAILIPEKIIFSEKASLKKKERKPIFIPLFNQRAFNYAAAAAILFLFGLFLSYNNNDNAPVYVAEKKVSKKNSASNLNQGKENSIIPTEKKQTEDLQKTENTKSNAPRVTNTVVLLAEKNNSSIPPLVTYEEEQALHNVLVQETTTAPTVADNEANEQKEQILIAENKEVKKADSVNNAVLNSPVMAVVVTQKQEDEYEAIGAVINKKLRSILGIKSAAECDESEKIGLWELAMAARNGIQKLTGAKGMEVKKVCDGKGEKVEYIFAAGKFEISKSTSR